MGKIPVFLDSSVIIASLLSATGGSFYIINSLKDEFKFQINEYALSEIQKVLKAKFVTQPSLQSRLFLILGTAKISILPNPPRRNEKQAAQYISKIDATILASALTHSDYLITLDNEFLKPEITIMSNKKSLIILKPKDFIEKFRV